MPLLLSERMPRIKIYGFSMVLMRRQDGESDIDSDIDRDISGSLSMSLSL
jgi:hypothetical protein